MTWRMFGWIFVGNSIASAGQVLGYLGLGGAILLAFGISTAGVIHDAYCTTCRRR